MFQFNENIELIEIDVNNSHTYKKDIKSAKLFENEMGAIPEYIKNILFVAGYNNTEVLKNIEDEDIAEIEKFARGPMLQLCQITEDFFGQLHNNAHQFFFVPGARKLIFLIKQTVCEKASFFNKGITKELSVVKEMFKRIKLILIQNVLYSFLQKLMMIIKMIIVAT